MTTTPRLRKVGFTASPVFALAVLVTLGVFGLIGVVLVQPGLVVGSLGQETAGHISGHFRSLDHRVHDLTFGFLVATAAVGMLAQFRAPSQNVAGQLMALIPWVGLMLGFVMTDTWTFAPAPILGALTLITTILHPAGRHFFRSFSVSRVNRLMLALVLIAAGPLMVFTSNNIELQKTLTDDHAALGHYGFLAAFGFTVIGVGLLASIRPDGWRLTAWIGGLLPALLGLASLVYPEVNSSLDPVWAIAAIAWGVGFTTTAELTQDAGGSTLPVSRSAVSKSTF